MLPLVPTLALAFISFISSAFVILRIVIPILPPHPLSRRVPPSEFGLPNFKTLSPADKSHIWLASFDLLALAFLVWQALFEYFGGTTGYGIASDPVSAVRLWIATTLRQSCLLVVASLTLLHVRMGRPVSFGTKHWMLWGPTLLLAFTSTALAGVLAGAGVGSFWWGLVGYSASVAIMSSVAFACLIGTLVTIRRNLTALNDVREPWPPVGVEKKTRPSFATEDVDALKDGSSWITSRASSPCESISAFSFSTHHTQHSPLPSNISSRVNIHPNLASNSSIPSKSSFWFNPATPAGRESPVPPVPPLPAPYRGSESTYNVNDDPDPFRRVDPRIRMGSQSSWLSENPGWQYEPTMSDWSFSRSESPHVHGRPLFPSSPDISAEFLATGLLPSRPLTPRTPLTPTMASTGVLGGYGYAPDAPQAENSGVTTSLMAGSEVDVSVYRALGWMVTIWVPMALALPYCITTQLSWSSSITSILLVLSVTLSSPLLAANILLRSPIPIPHGLFDSSLKPPSVVMRAPSPCSSTAENTARQYKHSGSVTVVEGRRSGDVWLSNGNAMESRTKVARALTLLQPKPKLSVLPLQEVRDDEVSPPMPIQHADDEGVAPPTPQTHNPAELGMNREMGTRKKDSKASSYYSGTDENMAIATKIMIAQRHYSALAMTMVLPPSPERRGPHELATTTAVEVDGAPMYESKRHSHLRARSISSINSIPHSAISAPPSTPLPPTPPTLKNFKAASASRRLAHRKSYSSCADEFSFGPIEDDNTKEIDALSAGLLPLLVPGLKVGRNMKISESSRMLPSVIITDAKQRKSRVPSELGGAPMDFSSQIHSTPCTRKARPERPKRLSTHKRNHFSLPSLNLGKDALSVWRSNMNDALDTKVGRYEPVGTQDARQDHRRATVYGCESTECLKVVSEEDEVSRPASPCYTTSIPDMLHVPVAVDAAGNSLVTLISALDQELRVPPSASSEVTLFDFDPSADGVVESTPQESKTQTKRLSRNSEVVPPVPALKTKSSHRSSIVYIKSDENVAPSSAASDVTGLSSPVTRPLVPRSKGTSKLRTKRSATDQENVAPAPAKGLRTLALLQDRDHSLGLVQETKPLSIGKSSKKKREVDSENTRRESSLKRALKPLKLVRSETTKQRAVLRENEVLPNVVIRPPSDGQHIGFSYHFQ